MNIYPIIHGVLLTSKSKSWRTNWEQQVREITKHQVEIDKLQQNLHRANLGNFQFFVQTDKKLKCILEQQYQLNKLLETTEKINPEHPFNLTIKELLHTIDLDARHARKQLHLATICTSTDLEEVDSLQESFQSTLHTLTLSLQQLRENLIKASYGKYTHIYIQL